MRISDWSSDVCSSDLGTDFGTKQSTQFHAKATQCTSCHVEHEGERGIIRMDHAALLDMAKWRQPLAGMSTNTRSLTSETALNCASCHAFSDPNQGLFGTDCASRSEEHTSELQSLM